MKRFLVPLCLLISSSLLLGLVALILVDRRVSSALEARRQPTMQGIYSSPLVVRMTPTLSADWLSTELQRRDYLAVAASPSQAGQYQLAGHRWEILVRPFQHPQFRSTRPQRVIVDLEKGTATNSERQELTFFVLEPVLLATLGSGGREAKSFRPLHTLPEHLQNAVLAVEDERFYRHHGIDLIGLSRALLVNIKARRIVQGGSTITQQLAKNMLFTPHRTFTRKALEALAAVSLELRLSKDEILELYLNEVYLGQAGPVAIHGVEEAARFFFAKAAADLDLAESALIAGIIRAPSYYAPQRHPQRAQERRDLVLRKLQTTGTAPPADCETALTQPLTVTAENIYALPAPYFLTALRSQLAEKLNLPAAAAAGVMVYTGLDAALQECAEQAVQDVLSRLEEGRSSRPGPRQLQGALVAIAPESGLVRAWVGGRDYSQQQFDRVAQAQRQIGSTVKPFVYLTALDPALNDYRPATPITRLPDEPLSVHLSGGQVWSPANFDRRFRGPVTLRYALETSLNVPTAYLTQRIGTPAVARVLEQLQLAERIQPLPAIGLGAVDSSLLRLTAAYAALANGGVFISPRLFITAADSSNEALIYSDFKEYRVADPAAVFVLTNILQGVVERGTAAAVRRGGFKPSAAGKTGTSDAIRDSWFIGYTPNLAVGAWVGRDDNQPHGLTGAAAAVPIWTEFMKCAEPLYPPADFSIPPGVVRVRLDSSSSQVATPECPHNMLVDEYFVQGTEPVIPCQRHRPAAERTEQYDGRWSSAEDTPQKRRRSFWDIVLGR